ncbi:MAG: NAD(P)H-dependent oxidoreductase, partial [Actinomycetota bacterium]|nr:NAD(P)H-dependent oxidoreductase [Actinomycetota bacterium]
MPQRILIVTQSRSGGTEQLVAAVTAGIDMANHELDEPIGVDTKSGLEASSADVLACDAVIIATPEHFGSMAGATKHFFEEIWHDCLDATRGLPWQLIVKAGNDGRGTIESVQRLVTGQGWTDFRPPLLASGDIRQEHL